jgi:cytochrome c peroxidase
MPRWQPLTRSLRQKIAIAGACAALAAAALYGLSASRDAPLLDTKSLTSKTVPTVASADAAGVPLDVLRAMFRRPPLEAPTHAATAAQINLGKRLFGETRLSADGKTSCATCHDPARSFADGRQTALSAASKRYPRNSPSLWNVASTRILFWDGRASTLPLQAKDAIENDMGSTLDDSIARLRADASYVTEFQRAFDGDAPMSGGTLLAAISTYERTLASPATRFDRWVQGDAEALSGSELSGLRLFSGKARCLACHGGWRFTDDNFHDIGLRSGDPGRHAIIGGAERAFKTPSLREARWSAPYMHDGSLASLSDVINHYAGSLEQRPSLASELKRGITLSASERADLLAFLGTLSSDRIPREDDSAK